MTKWEYMFVRHFDGRIMAINLVKYPNPEKQMDWQVWLVERGREGWELVSEYTLNASNTVHATLKRQKPE
jgi:hypothetical protein